MRRRNLWIILAAAAAGLLLSQSRPAASSKEDTLWQYRNRGKAFYENPTTQLQAVDEFKKALDISPGSTREQLNYGLALLRAGKMPEGVAELEKVRAKDPSLPHTWFNLGIFYKKQGETEKSQEMLERMVQLVPSDPISHYNLGVLYKLHGKVPESIEKFRLTSRLNPTLAAPHFQLYNAFRLAGKKEDAAKELALFQELKKIQETTGSAEDMEWNDYAEIYDPIDPSISNADAVPMPALKFTTRTLPGKLAGDRFGAAVLDFDADGKPDLLAWSNQSGGLLYRGAVTPVANAALKEGRAFAIGDIDNDGFPDLVMLTDKAAVLLRNRKGAFVKDKTLAEGAFVKAIWIDYDHDYDLDLLLVGAKPMLLRNQGESGFVDRTADFPFVTGTAVDAVSFRLIPDSKSNDVLITYSNHASVLYRDRLAGKYEATPLDAVEQGADHLTAWDWNHDGAFDIAFVSNGQLKLLANQRTSWKPQTAPSINLASNTFAFADPANMGVSELVAGDSAYPLNGASRKAPGLHSGQAIAAADFNGDGRIDFATASPDGIFVSDNASVLTNRWITVKLAGTKNLKLAYGSEVEVKAGMRYQKKLYTGAPLQFGLRAYQQIDTVRITWPNGLIQNEAKQIPGRAIEYKEAQRLSGSCPMIYTWDGKEFRFLTDVLGVAPLGASSGDGKFFPTDHDEYVWIPGEVLTARDGAYRLRITEELGEVTYLDQLKLIAVYHREDTELYSNDKWKSPPYPEFRLFGTRQRMYPTRAIDDAGHDVLDNLRRPDGRYAGSFTRTMINTALMHSLQLDFGSNVPNKGAFLVLNGWVDWADGSTFLKQSQESGQSITPPYLQVRDAKGDWKTVIDDMGIPSGKTKTIAVDLSGKFLSASRDVRIVTNMVVYWDEAFLGIENEKPDVTLHPMLASKAELGFHGFSKPFIDPQRRQPEYFSYLPTTTTSAWNPTPGMYTRYGDVVTLLDQSDDRFTIFGSGDEIRLQFPALPPPARGYKRDFLLYVDGWAKDSDPNTAYSATVEPLPFHKMSQYPYGAHEHYPDDAAHREYRQQFNTRPALRLMRALPR